MHGELSHTNEIIAYISLQLTERTFKIEGCKINLFLEDCEVRSRLFQLLLILSVCIKIKTCISHTFLRVNLEGTCF